MFCTAPCDHAKVPESWLLQSQCIHGCTRIEPAQLNFGCTRDVAWMALCWLEAEDQQAHDVHQFVPVALLALLVPRMLLKDRICSIFTRPSFDSSAHHTTSRCSNNELLRPTLMPKKIQPKNLPSTRSFLSTLKAWLVGETHADMHV